MPQPPTTTPPADLNNPVAGENPSPATHSAAPENEEPLSSQEGLPFKYRDGLIYYTSELDDGRERLCIPKKLAGEIFALAHDRLGHADYHKIYDRAVASFYIRKMSRKLQAYVAHCPQCQQNRTARHSPYGSLRPIQSPATSFHIVTIDFILAMSVTIEGEYCVVISVTFKFSSHARQKHIVRRAMGSSLSRCVVGPRFGCTTSDHIRQGSQVHVRLLDRRLSTSGHRTTGVHGLSSLDSRPIRAH